MNRIGAALLQTALQRRSIVGMIPNPAAASVCIRPPVSHGPTASLLRSSLIRRFVLFAMETPSGSAAPILGVRRTEG